MKKINLKYSLAALVMLFAASACEEQLDINTNPNAPTQADVELVLPQAITSSAAVASQYNSYGAHFGGFMANAGGFSGFGNLLNYNLTPSDWNNLWVSTYADPLQDLKYVIDKTEGVDEFAYYNAAAKIMSVVNYQRLVDAFGNIPYSEALRAEEGIVGPKYDDASTVYQSLFAELDEAINTMETAEFPKSLTEGADPLFSELNDPDHPEDQVEAWKKFANTLKLRILIRLSSKPDFAAFVAQGFANLDLELGFIEDDAIVDPGYELNRPNPAWATWGKTIAGALSNSSRIPTTYAFAFYNGVKIDDSGRGEAVFVNFPATPNNQLGNEDGAPTIVANQVTWASNDTDGIGVLKGPAMGQPLMLLAEAKLLIAEAALKGFLAVDYEDAYYEGILASFTYLYKDESENVVTDGDDNTPADLFEAYLADNEGNRLVWIDEAANDTERLEAIITQKYIALNMINSDEAWNEYRRTGFPKSSPGGGAANDIASNKSNISGRPDKLPTRVLYPSTEQSYNAANFVAVNPSSDLIFWDPN